VAFLCFDKSLEALSPVQARRSLGDNLSFLVVRKVARGSLIRCTRLAPYLPGMRHLSLALPCPDRSIGSRQALSADPEERDEAFAFVNEREMSLFG